MSHRVRRRNRVHIKAENLQIGNNNTLNRSASSCSLHTLNCSTCDSVGLRRSVSLLECNIYDVKDNISTGKMENRNNHSNLIDIINKLEWKVEEVNQRQIQMNSRLDDFYLTNSKEKNKGGKFKNVIERLKKFFKSKAYEGGKENNDNIILCSSCGQLEIQDQQPLNEDVPHEPQPLRREYSLNWPRFTRALYSQGWQPFRSALYSQKWQPYKGEYSQNWQQYKGEYSQNWQPCKGEYSQNWQPYKGEYSQNWQPCKGENSQNWQPCKGEYSQNWQPYKGEYSQDWQPYKGEYSQDWQPYKGEYSQDWQQFRCESVQDQRQLSDDVYKYLRSRDLGRNYDFDRKIDNHDPCFLWEFDSSFNLTLIQKTSTKTLMNIK
ncbi:hypothetical protein LOTGIDRAFT_157452 [Lottia gigantea]|uniref:Uncharacterized protein n=1 Tax=Lottia gigantea TaxID=225164 RepID=V4B1R9_LOTGI|nr:hypothetical protein LOTGIDRAFT_157452 [Lottia gigantea]ESP01276.1 hypothetical protein LOTGIDRAFT_157452 [Lottia gigantea]